MLVSFADKTILNEVLSITAQESDTLARGAGEAGSSLKSWALLLRNTGRCAQDGGCRPPQ